MLEIGEELRLGRRVGPRLRRGRHHAGAELADDFLPGLGIVGDVHDVDLVEEEAGVQGGRRLIRAVVALDAMVGDERLRLRLRKAAACG